MPDKFLNADIKITKDGSHTLYSSRFNQHYHNPNGAVSESKHIFFEKNGLKDALKSNVEINILEIGFGTGLNFLILLDEYLKTASARINYHTVEAFPVSPRTIESLNYKQFLHQPELAAKLSPLFNSIKKGMNYFEPLNEISVTVFHGCFEDYNPGKLKFAFIFHDAFSPDVNPELWTSEVFKRLYKSGNSDAILTTYCAASVARGAMAHAGWKVARAEGALGKREMTIASPDSDKLKPFKRVNEKRLAKRYEDGSF